MKFIVFIHAFIQKFEIRLNVVYIMQISIILRLMFTNNKTNVIFKTIKRFQRKVVSILLNSVLLNTYYEGLNYEKKYFCFLNYFGIK